jgi:hypothetical protein
MSVGQPGGVAGGNIAGGGGSAHSPPYRDVDAELSASSIVFV